MRPPRAPGGYRDLSTKIKAAFAAGKVPTMAQAFENNIALYLEAKALLPIESLGVRLQGVNLTFLNAVRFGGVVYGVPFNKSIQVLYYNKDLLKKHGVPVPATLEEFVAAAKRLSRAEGALFTGSSPTPPPSPTSSSTWAGATSRTGSSC